jgi:hypothetical protein
MHRKSRKDMQEVMGQDQTTASRPQPNTNARSRCRHAARGGNHVAAVALVGITQTTVRQSRERSGVYHAIHIQHYNELRHAHSYRLVTWLTVKNQFSKKNIYS